MEPPNSDAWYATCTLYRYKGTNSNKTNGNLIEKIDQTFYR